MADNVAQHENDTPPAADAEHEGAPAPAHNDVSNHAQQPSSWRPLVGKVLRRVGITLLMVGLPILILMVLLGGMAALLFPASGQIRERAYNDRLWDGGPHKIAVIHLSGTILSSGGYIKEQIERVHRDKRVKGVVLRINSPGGLVSASDQIYDALKKLRTARGSDGTELPMVVSMGAIAASGGYYAAMAVGKSRNSIYAEPTTWTGSIGVIIPYYDMSALFKETLKVKEDSIRSHELKGMGSLGRELSPTARARFQKLVDEAFVKFKKIVKAGRPDLSEGKIDQIATGEVFTVEEAQQHGLVDKQGYLDDAISACIDMAQLSPSEVNVIEYQRPPSLTDMLMGKSKPSVEASTLANMATPQPYFICTWLPGMLSGD